MNKDVIYIEPEQDITDILSNVKAAKHKIIALVPPKKAGVLRSAVNFKLIAKTARQHEKTVVLITTDESLQRLASTVKMPVAKSLQSKPQIPNLDDEEATDDADDDVIEDDEKPAEEEKAAEDEKVPVETAPKKAEPVLAKKPAKEEVIEGEPEPEEKENSSKAAKAVAKMKGAKIPNFAKYRKFIIAGMAVLIVLIGFTVWATAIAPAAEIVVTVHASKSNFAEKVTFVDHEDKADPKNGVLYLEEKTVTKTAETPFDATGELDKGTKASGTITITRPKGDGVNCNEVDSLFSIPKDTIVTIGGKEFVVTEGGSANALDSKGQITYTGRGSHQVCMLAENITSGAIKVVAKEVGDGYNIAASNDIKLGISTTKRYSGTSSAMTGGSSKIVKIVSEEDVKAATSGLTATSAEKAQKELKSQFGDEYILLGNMEQGEPKDTVTPNVDEEVGENVKPKVVREVVFKMFAVKKESVKTFITKKLKENASGDKTQTIYSAGENEAFFEKFQNTTDESTARLKTSVITGPKVTEQMVADKSLGKKVGEVKHLLQSINGVSSVSVNPNYFWVTSVPSDPNKVQIKVTVEQ
ncbi:hypothetical protein IKQ65_01975 [Candidatus Saccharibacteria bacterium]|nr:hypothetical protein [Candidatus Saccharibacteria bacterium]